jgi:1-deoxy-D-xylulose-5-phosphate synthase
VRFPKGPVPPALPALQRRGGVDVLARDGDEDVLLVAVGPMAELCLDVAQRLRDQGVGVTVVDPRWVLPVPQEVVALAARHRLVVSVEDGGRSGGVSSVLAAALRAAGVPTPLRDYGIPQRFLEHAKRPQVLDEIGLTAQEVSRQVIEAVARLDPDLAHAPLTD